MECRKKLDLNVEFSDEVVEEKVGFFEGLDGFLSILLILHVVGDEKAKPS